MFTHLNGILLLAAVFGILACILISIGTKGSRDGGALAFVIAFFLGLIGLITSLASK